MKQLWNDLINLSEAGYAVVLLAGFFLLTVAFTFWITRNRKF